jgi:hypothetical protein
MRCVDTRGLMVMGQSAWSLQKGDLKKRLTQMGKPCYVQVKQLFRSGIQHQHWLVGSQSRSLNQNPHCLRLDQRRTRCTEH